jgi:uncharacterized protein
MTVLVTGATGRLGRRLVERMLGGGHQVRVLTRRPFLADRLFGARADVYEWHPGAEPLPQAALAGVAGVAHLMGEPFAGPGTPARLQQIGVARGVVTQRLVDALGTRRIRLVVASLAVPPVASATPDEYRDSQTAELPSTGLGAIVAANEALAIEARSRGISVAIARLGLLLEPGDFWTRLTALAARGGRLHMEDSRVPVIEIDDASALLAGLLTRTDLEGVFYGVSPTPLAGRDLLEMLGPARRLPFNRPMLRRSLERRLGPLAPMLYSRTHLVPQRLMEAGAVFSHPDPLSITRHLVASAIEARRMPLLGLRLRRRKPASTGDIPVGPAHAAAEKVD